MPTQEELTKALGDYVRTQLQPQFDAQTALITELTMRIEKLTMKLENGTCAPAAKKPAGQRKPRATKAASSDKPKGKLNCLGLFRMKMREHGPDSDFYKKAATMQEGDSKTQEEVDAKLAELREKGSRSDVTFIWGCYSDKRKQIYKTEVSAYNDKLSASTAPDTLQKDGSGDAAADVVDVKDSIDNGEEGEKDIILPFA